MELIRLLGDDDTVLQLSISTNHIQVNTDQFVFTSKLIDGKFPDFNRVIPKKLETVLDLHKEEFKGALQRTAILCNEKFHGVKLNFKEKMLDLSAHNPEQEEAEEKIELNQEVEKMEIGFNVNYLLEAVTSLETDLIKMSISNASTGVLLEQTDYENCTFLYVVMPMRL